MTRQTGKHVILVILLLASAHAITLLSPSLHADAVSEEERLFIITNQERASRGIAMVRRDTLLSQVARNYSREMMEHEFFSHVSQVDGSTFWNRISRSGYYDGYLGRIVIRENLALLSGSANAENAHQGFMNSQGHRENLLADDVNEMGVGITEGVFQSIFASIYVEVFAYHSRDQQELTISASIDPSIATVQRGETATFRIRIESNVPTTATVQVSNISPMLLWNIDRSSGPTPLNSVLTIGTSSAPTGTYAFNIIVTASELTRTLSSSLTVLQSTQTTTQTSVSTTSTT
ncbi:MAG: CAP domain-containing protein, partial [archaeon]